MDNGVPSYAEYDARIAELEGRIGPLAERLDQLNVLSVHARALVAKAAALVKLMDEAETHHGGLIGGVTLRAKNELRLELSKWK